MPKRFSHDWGISICLFALCGFGASLIASVQFDLLFPQMVFYLVGFLLYFLFSKIDYRVYFSMGKLVYVVSILLLLFTLFLGFESHGAVRWVSIGPFRLQFSELLKPFMIVSFAAFITSLNRVGLISFLSLLLFLAVPIFLVFKQPDLGSSLVYLAGVSGMIFLSGINLVYIVSIIVSAFAIFPLFWHFLAQYQKDRLLSFVRPEIDPQGISYNAIQAIITVGSGQLFGKGLGRGTQSHLSFLPERHTDFMFASVAEELGFIGAGAVILIYFVLIWKIFSIAFKSSDRYSYLIACGVGCSLAVQIFINIGMNIGVLPITGITLPLISYGGSSVLATLIQLGIIQNISSEQKEVKAVHIV